MLADMVQTEADRNYAAFRKLLPDLLGKAPGKYVVMHDGMIGETFDTFRDAVRYGHDKFGKDKFSVQEITSQGISLGFYSYALCPYTN